MIDLVVTFALAYLFAGSLVWVAMDPNRFADYATNWSIKRYGRLPTKTFQVCAVMVLILFWPRVVIAGIRTVAR